MTDSGSGTESTLLTAAEVAGILRLRVVTVTDMCRTGELPASKVRASWRITRADVDAYLAANRNQPVKAAV